MANKPKSERSASVEYCIYIHILKEDGRMYVGKAQYRMQSNGVLNRWGVDGKRYEPKPNPRTGITPISHFWNAIQEKGWDAFDHIIVTRGLNAEAAEELEAALIEEFDTIKNGFNLTKGRDGGARPGHKTSEETKAKISAANRARASDPESHKRRSEATKKVAAERDPEKLKSMIEKQLQTKKEHGPYISGSNKEVYCLELDKSWISGTVAAKELGLSRSSVTESARHNGTITGGKIIINNILTKLHWIYKEN